MVYFFGGQKLKRSLVKNLVGTSSKLQLLIQFILFPAACNMYFIWVNICSAFHFFFFVERGRVSCLLFFTINPYYIFYLCNLLYFVPFITYSFPFLLISPSVWSRKSAISQAHYALDVGPRILRYFEDYFDLAYPLPKMDMIGIPDFGPGAMENWGLATYRLRFSFRNTLHHLSTFIFTPMQFKNTFIYTSMSFKHSF